MSTGAQVTWNVKMYTVRCHNNAHREYVPKLLNGGRSIQNTTYNMRIADSKKEPPSFPQVIFLTELSWLEKRGKTPKHVWGRVSQKKSFQFSLEKFIFFVTRKYREIQYCYQFFLLIIFITPGWLPQLANFTVPPHRTSCFICNYHHPFSSFSILLFPKVGSTFWPSRKIQSSVDWIWGWTPTEIGASRGG